MPHLALLYVAELAAPMAASSAVAAMIAYFKVRKSSSKL
jgi:hypothetical protein